MQLTRLTVALFGLALTPQAFGGTVRELSIDLNGLTARFVGGSNPSSSLSVGLPPALQLAPGNVNNPVTSASPLPRLQLPAQFGSTSTGSLYLQQDSDSIGMVETDLSEARLAMGSFGFAGRIDLVNGNITGGFLRLSSLADTNEVVLDISPNGTLRQFPTGGNYLLRSDGSKGYVSGSTLAGLDTSIWEANAPNDSGFVAIRLAPNAGTLVDTNVDLDISILAVVPAPLPILGGGALLALIAGARKFALKA
jgi:hypothetical protein